MPSQQGLLACVLGTALLQAGCMGGKPVSGCSDGWYITGYFTPVEQDYPPEPRVAITTSDGQQHALPQAFVEAVKVEGWGKLAAGYYIGEYHNAWHTSSRPLDSQGNTLQIGSIATDKRKIPHGSTVTIPVLNNYTFTANDIGTSIKGKHIDIFCGEGRPGELLTYRMTKKNVEVCVRLQ